MHFQLFRIDSEGSEGTLVAAYHRGRYAIKARKPFVELFDGYEDILDTLIGMDFEMPEFTDFSCPFVVTCIIAVSKRKDSEGEPKLCCLRNYICLLDGEQRSLLVPRHEVAPYAVPIVDLCSCKHYTEYFHEYDYRI